MAISYITTETGDRIVQETIAGITGASSLNDTHIESIMSDDLSIDPVTNNWSIGSNWEWDSINNRLKIV